MIGRVVVLVLAKESRNLLVLGHSAAFVPSDLHVDLLHLVGVSRVGRAHHLAGGEGGSHALCAKHAASAAGAVELTPRTVSVSCISSPKMQKLLSANAQDRAALPSPA